MTEEEIQQRVREIVSPKEKREVMSDNERPISGDDEKKAMDDVLGKIKAYDPFLAKIVKDCRRAAGKYCENPERSLQFTWDCIRAVEKYCEIQDYFMQLGPTLRRLGTYESEIDALLDSIEGFIDE